MGFGEDILEAQKMLKKQPFLKPASPIKEVKEIKEEAVNTRLFKPAGQSEIDNRPKPKVIPMYHVYDFDDLNNSTDQWTTDFDQAVKIAKKLVQSGWTRVRIEKNENPDDEDGDDFADIVWVGGEDEYGGDVDYSTEQAEQDLITHISEALGEERPFFKPASRVEIDNRRTADDEKYQRELLSEIVWAVGEAAKNKKTKRLKDELRELYQAVVDRDRAKMIDILVDLARSSENYYIDHDDDSWKSHIWTIKELCNFSEAERREWEDRCNQLGI